MVSTFDQHFFYIIWKRLFGVIGVLLIDSHLSAIGNFVKYFFFSLLDFRFFFSSLRRLYHILWHEWILLSVSAHVQSDRWLVGILSFKCWFFKIDYIIMLITIRLGLSLCLLSDSDFTLNLDAWRAYFQLNEFACSLLGLIHLFEHL